MIKLGHHLLVDLDKESLPKVTAQQTIITYGLTPQAMITASSITDDNVSLCVQQSFRNRKGELVEQQEFPVVLAAENQLPNDALCQGAIELVLGYI